jgi:hypothetical protein
MNFIVEWYPLNGISNIGFNDQATNTSLHKIFFSKSSEPITDKNLCFSYIGVGNTSFLWKVYWLTRVLFKTVNKCFKVR